jgi:hypothetical protein
MQVFVAYPDIQASVDVLDRRRLGKQRVEGVQIMEALLLGTGWRHHPAVGAWRGCEDALAVYILACCKRWQSFGYSDTRAYHVERLAPARSRLIRMPSWWGDPAVHASHRSNLLRKDPVYYGQFGWSEPANLPYVWPKGD